MTTVSLTPAEPKTARAGINETKFLSSMKHLFASSFSFLGELMQNARRAGATRIHFLFNEATGKFGAFDDGCGITDFAVLVRMCESGWDEKTMREDKPFGMGLFSLFFAGSRVTFRSRGQKLSLTLDDIIECREVKVEADPESASIAGTFVEIDHLKVGGNAKYFELDAQLRSRSKGFPIPVALNVVELPRPHAQGELRGQMTPIGFVSMQGVHNPGDLQTDTHCITYLQGLPIGPYRSYHSDHRFPTIVHLDSEQFSACMPDRSDLFDRDKQASRIAAAVNAVAAQFLEETKAGMDGKAFVEKYWAACMGHDRGDLLVDIPWIPSRLLWEVQSVSADSESVWGYPDAQGAGSIAMADIANGVVPVWLDVPDSTEWSAWSPTILKLMQLGGIKTVDAHVLPKGHWLNVVAHSTEHFQFEVSVNGAKGSAQYDYSALCRMEVVETVRVRVTSSVAPQYEQTFLIEDNWLVVPQGYDTASVDDDGNTAMWERDTHCFVTAKCPATDEPVDVFSDFKDESESYRDEWRDQSSATWLSLLAGLQGQALSHLLRTALYGTPVQLSGSHLNQLALVRAQAPDDNPACAPRMQVVDLDEPGFWTEVATLTGLYKGPKAISAASEKLQRAFAVAAQTAGARVLEVGAVKTVDLSPTAE